MKSRRVAGGRPSGKMSVIDNLKTHVPPYFPIVRKGELSECLNIIYQNNHYLIIEFLNL